MSAAVATSQQVSEEGQDALGRPRPYLWGLSVARLMGRGARWAAVQAGTVSAVVSRRSGIPPSPELVQRLSELMKDADEERQRELAADPEFWFVIEELHRHRPAPTRRPAVARIDAPAAETGTDTESKQAKKAKGKSKAKAEASEPQADATDTAETGADDAAAPAEPEGAGDA